MRSAVGLLIALTLVPRAIAQRQHVDSFEDAKTAWELRFLPANERSATTVVQHQRERSGWNSSGHSETFRLSTTGRNQRAVLAYPLPPARPFDELKLRVRVKSTQAGHRLAVRLVFVDHENPGTGKPLTVMVRGSSYQQVNTWQELVCQIDSKAVSRALQELRARTSLPLPTPGYTYVDTAAIVCDFNPGAAEIAIDKLDFGPIIAPQRVVEPAGYNSDGNPSQSANDSQSRASMRLGQLRIDGRPFFPRMVPYHGESVDSLRFAGVNTVLVPDASDSQLLARLNAAGIHAIAVPPTPRTHPTTQLVSNANESITDHAGILFWYLGTQIAQAEQDKLLKWTRWLKSADPQRRPIMADVNGAERTFSRHLNMLGVSRSILGTSVSLRAYRNSLLQRRTLAQPGKFTWTWIQPPKRKATIVEPEQLRLQTYAALSAGSKAIGFWSKSALDEETGSQHERLLMMHQLNLEMGLIEDWLAVGRQVGNVRCEAGASLQPTRRATNVKLLHQAEEQRKRSLSALTGTTQQRRTTNVEASVFNTPYGRLLLPVWYSDSAQFCPGELVASNLSLVVHVPEAERSAWLVTTTGLRTLKTNKQEGGLRIHLSTADGRTFLDQTAIVVVTSRQDVLAALRRRIAQVAADSADTMIRLATAKRDRVLAVEGTLAVSDGRTQTAINQATQELAMAQSSLEQSNYDSARLHAQQAMRLLRRLQHARWKTATQKLSSPVASPYAVSYQTLPNHNALHAHLLSVRADRVANLMPLVSGNNATTLRNTGWSRFPGASDAIRKQARFARAGERYSLTLTAAATNPRESPEIIAVPPMRVTSPVMNVTPGEIVRVSGRVRVPTAIAANVDGAMLFDNMTGPAGAIRWGKQTRGWVPFELVRTADAAGAFYVTLLLSGLGSVQVSDMAVEVYPAMSPIVAER